MSKTIQEVALAAHGAMELPEGVEGHLDAVLCTTRRISPIRTGLMHLRR